MSVGQLLERFRNGTSSISVWVCQNWSVAVTENWGWISLGANVWIAKSYRCVFLSTWVSSVVLIAKSLWVFSKFWCLADITGGYCQSTSWTRGSFLIVEVSHPSSAVQQWRWGVFSLIFGPQPGHFHFSCSLCSLPLTLVLSHRFSVRRSQPICCIGSIKAFLYRVVGFATGLTGWVHISWIPVFSIVCIVSIAVFGISVVRVRVCLTTVVNIVSACNFFVVDFLSFELTALCTIVAWSFAVVTCRLGLFKVRFCGMLRHTVYLQVIWVFLTMPF